METTDIFNGKSVAISQPSGQGRPFNIVLIYDHDLAASESRRVIDRLLAKCLPDLDIHRDELSFAEITHPELRGETVELAAECDLFILATITGEGLPAEILGWVNLWLASREDKETALVCLVGSPTGETLESVVHQHLQRIAVQHELAFFSSSFLAKPGRIASDLGGSGFGKAHENHYDPRPEAWGINE